jgi:hypothetical protein
VAHALTEGDPRAGGVCLAFKASLEDGFTTEDTESTEKNLERRLIKFFLWFWLVLFWIFSVSAVPSAVNSL